MTLEHCKKNIKRKPRQCFHRLFACVDGFESESEEKASCIVSYADSDTGKYEKHPQCARIRSDLEQRVRPRKSCLIQNRRPIIDAENENNVSCHEIENCDTDNERRRWTRRRLKPEHLHNQRCYHGSHQPCQSCCPSKLAAKSPTYAAGVAKHRHKKRLMVAMLDDGGIGPYTDCDAGCQMNVCTTYDDINIRQIFQQITDTMDAKCRSESPMEISRSSTQKASRPTYSSAQKTSYTMTLPYSSPPHKSADKFEQQVQQTAFLTRGAPELPPSQTCQPLSLPQTCQPLSLPQTCQPLPLQQTCQPLPLQQTCQPLPPPQTSQPLTTSLVTQQLLPFQIHQAVFTSEATQSFPSSQIPATHTSNLPVKYFAPKSSPEQQPHSQIQQQTESHQVQKSPEWSRVSQTSILRQQLKNKNELELVRPQVTVAGCYPTRNCANTKRAMLGVARRGYRLFRRDFTPSCNYYGTQITPMESIRLSKDEDQWEDLEIQVKGHSGVKAMKPKISAKLKACDGKQRLGSGGQARNASCAQCYGTPSGDTPEQQLANVAPTQDHLYRQQQQQQRYQVQFDRLARTKHDRAADLNVTGNNSYEIQNYGAQVHFSHSHHQFSTNKSAYHQTAPGAAEVFVRQRAVLQPRLPTCSSPRFQRDRQVQDFEFAASSRYGKL